MSTPVHQLPPSGGQSATAPPVDDPEVLSMLNEMEVEVQEATKQQHVATARPPMMPAVAHIPVSPPTPTVKKATPKGLWNMEMAQKAVIYAVIASILFYPATLKVIYGKIPKFEHIFTSYDALIRTVLLAIVIYLAMMYLPL